MPTLIQSTKVREKTGNMNWTPKKPSHCNSHCYNAKCEVCMCVCGGLNHGVGLQKAIENTIEMQRAGIDGVKYNEKYLKEQVEKIVIATEPEQTPVATPARKRDAKGHFVKQT